MIANCFKKAGFHISPEVMGEEECMRDEEEECVQDEWDNVQEIFLFQWKILLMWMTMLCLVQCKLLNKYVRGRKCVRE
jgi:hypothetical protein